jgi:indolepyruvate ferredoxin oxidoreductase, beta subunit
MSLNNGKITNVLLVGVGGQGVLLASDILSEVAMEAGFDARKSEVHGMAQRGGVVSSHLRFGDKVWSAMIPDGQADVMMAFEQAEAMRAMHMLHPGGIPIVNTQTIIPPIASGGKFSYPEDPLGTVKGRYPGTISFDAFSECRALGNEKMISVLFLGALAAKLEFSPELWKKVIMRRVPKGTEDGNWRAFMRGMELAEG